MKLDKKTIWILVGLVGGGVLLNWLLNHFDVVGGIFSFIWGLVFPFVLGFVLAFLLNLPMSAIERRLFTARGKPVRRGASFGLTIFIVVAAIAFVVGMMVPQLWQTVLQLGRAMPGYLANAEKALQPYLDYLPTVEEWLKDLDVDWKSLVSQATSLLSSGAGNFLSSAVGVATDIVGGFVSFFVGVVFAVYLLLDKEHLTAQLQGLMQAYLPMKTYEKITEISHLVYRTYAKFVSGQCTEALIVGLIYLVVLLVGGFQYALLIAVVVGLTTLIPMIGAWLGFAFGLFLIIVSMGFWPAVIFTIIFVVIQQIEGNLIYPHVVGSSVGLPPMWILVAVMVGGGFGGIFGMLFFIPLFSVLYTLLHRNAKKHLQAKGIPSPVDDLPPKKAKKKRAFKFGTFARQKQRAEEAAKAAAEEAPGDIPEGAAEEAPGDAPKSPAQKDDKPPK